MIPQTPSPQNFQKPDTHSYQGWLNSDSFMKRAFAIYGYMMVAGLIIAIPFYIMGIIMMMFVFSQIQMITQKIPRNYIPTVQQQQINTNIPLTINQPTGDFNCDGMYKEIEKDIKNANYCQLDSDCDVLILGGWYVDFGCYHFINKRVDKEQFYTKMEAYKKKCSQMINECASAPEVKCASNKCVSVTE